jgi:soluble lytic murein transglycosylase-like protein
MRRVIALATLLVPLQALAGAQLYEPLSASMAVQMSALIAEQAPIFFNFKNPNDAHKWIDEMSRRLRDRIPDRKQRVELLKSVQYEAIRARLDPQLVLGLIQVESGFRKYAVSSSGARGYMQVMPFDIENGDYFRALGRYNGSLGRPEYPNAVNAAWQGPWKYDGAKS